MKPRNMAIRRLKQAEVALKTVAKRATTKRYNLRIAAKLLTTGAERLLEAHRHLTKPKTARRSKKSRKPARATKKRS